MSAESIHQSDGTRGEVLLVTGAGGGMAAAFAAATDARYPGRYRWVGIDPRLSPERTGELKFPGEIHRLKYTDRKLIDLFKDLRPRALVHLGRIPPGADVRRSTRYSSNVLGTKNLLELCKRYEVGSAIVLSTYHVYGALPANPFHLSEEDPLRASQTYPELSDSVDLDTTTTAFSLRNPQVKTIILRPANIVGPSIQNRMTHLLRHDVCPRLLGYDPFMQFIHESDLGAAITLCLDKPRSGVYNVAGEGLIPFSHAIKHAGARPLPIPHPLAYSLLDMAKPLLRRLHAPFPKHLVDYFRYPVIMSDAAFRRDFGYEPAVRTVSALESIRRGGVIGRVG